MFFRTLANAVVGNTPKRLFSNSISEKSLISPNKVSNYKLPENPQKNILKKIYLGGVLLTAGLGLWALLEPRKPYEEPVNIAEVLVTSVLVITWPICLPLFIIFSYQIYKENEERRSRSFGFKYSP